MQLHFARKGLIAALFAGIGPSGLQMSGQTPPTPADAYQWLEDVNGERSMAWVRAENERSAKILESDPRYSTLQAYALKVLESPERLPFPSINRDEVYNSWQAATHVRGILRRTTIADYLQAQPHWQTVLDYDALGKQDRQPWVESRDSYLYPGDELCLTGLSAGGEDAETMREFNLKTGQFVPGGFVLPRSKQTVAWIDKNTLLVARDWGPGTMTKSGYPFIVKIWKRGQPLEQATEVFRGAGSDMEVEPATFHDSEGRQATLIFQAVNFFEVNSFLLTPNGITRIALPRKSDVIGLLKGQIVLTINEDWKPEGSATTFVKGSVVSFDLEAARKDPLHLKPVVIFAPSPTEFAQGFARTRNRLIVTTLENVQGRAYIYSLDSKGVWTRKKLPVPENRTVSIISANWSDDRFFLSLTGFLTPSSLLLGDAETGVLKEAKALPPQFDASADVVEQLSATSKDGTRVPYFVVHRKDMRYDGSNPTLLYAYKASSARHGTRPD